MPKFDLLKSFSVVAFGALVGYGSVKYVQEQSSPNRYLASMTMTKMASEQFSKTLFDVSMKNIEIGNSENDLSTVQVKIEAFRNIPEGIMFSWNLPEDVQLVDGPKEGVLAGFAENETQTLTLKIKGYSKFKKSFISFALEGHIDQVPLKREVLLSSRPEDSFEYIVQQIEKSKKENIKAQGKIGKKSIYKGPIDLNKVVR